MIVPFTKGQKGRQQPPPDEAMLLMALAHMKAIGRIPPDQPPPAQRAPAPAKPEETD